MFSQTERQYITASKLRCAKSNNNLHSRAVLTIINSSRTVLLQWWCEETHIVTYIKVRSSPLQHRKPLFAPRRKIRTNTGLVVELVEDEESDLRIFSVPTN
jgi:hypothetical protein